MRPRGLGLRLISRQLQPLFALDGDKCPFVFSTTTTSGEATDIDASAFVFERALTLRDLIGLLLFALDLRKVGSESGSSSSCISSLIGAGGATRLFAAERVVGPKYPSRS
jgi:hypothetical protein